MALAYYIEESDHLILRWRNPKINTLSL